MKISVIIPTYNEEKVIKECLLSLDEQSDKRSLSLRDKDFEVIVVDDGSTDNTFQIVSSFKPKKYKLTVLKQEHNGPAMARNLGAKKAGGKILVFVDSDMTFDSKFLANLVEPIEQETTKGTFSKEEYVSNKGNVWSKCWGINEGWEEGMRHTKNHPDHQKVFRAILKSEFDRVGGFSKGGYTDDYSLSEKLGYEANSTKGVFYHKNPETLGEIYHQAKWVGKRNYKLGLIGVFVALIRSSLLVSIVVGIVKSIVNFNVAFFVFKIVYDFGSFVGLLEMIIVGKTAK